MGDGGGAGRCTARGLQLPGGKRQRATVEVNGETRRVRHWKDVASILQETGAETLCLTTPEGPVYVDAHTVRGQVSRQLSASTRRALTECDPLTRASVQSAALAPGVRRFAALDPSLEGRVVERLATRPELAGYLCRRHDATALAYAGVIERPPTHQAPPLERPATVFEVMALADPAGVVGRAHSGMEANGAAHQVAIGWAGAALTEHLRAEGLERTERIVALARIWSGVSAYVEFTDSGASTELEDHTAALRAALGRPGARFHPEDGVETEDGWHGVALDDPDLEAALAIQCGDALLTSWNGSTRINGGWHLMQEAAAARSGLTRAELGDALRTVGTPADHQLGVAAARAVIDDMQARTERHLRAAGVEEVRVWRYGRVPRAEGISGETELPHLPLISTTGAASLPFAKRDNDTGSGALQVIAYELTVPVEDVISVPGTGLGTYLEAEAVVVGGARAVRVAAATEFAEPWSPAGMHKWTSDQPSGPDYTSGYDPTTGKRVREALTPAGRRALGLDPPLDPWDA